ncbi:hypothetical protein AEAC466_17365 [Asticcacaulis sp. AC466]|uniref:hypothetical protein n=1 Tax=Asticcacaulis sp. AC466 TaxID=1282362 RepID=UPI0003C3D285|nr:hypothetical protein [Asticcacaulis sp. AC466]ESQ82392.1 hypothetical protein AEAC466_17365 [Asticcacaulis sp. AC466]
MSKREDVLSAILQLVKDALPSADVGRNLDEPESIPPGGRGNIFDGDLTLLDVDLSPLTYNYEHNIPVDLLCYETAVLTREQVLDAMLEAIGQAVEGDRTLGGLCDWLDLEPVNTENAAQSGAVPAKAGLFAFVAAYSTPNPLL